MSIIKHLKIEKDYELINPTHEGMIGELSKINIFIGANNTGKSRFMRSLFYVNNDYKLKFLPNCEKYDKFLEQISEFEKSYPKRNWADTNERIRAKNNIYKSLKGIDYLEESKINYFDLLNIYKETNNSELKNYGNYVYECNEIFNNYFDEIEFNDNFFRYDFYKIYIPSLRGLIPLIHEDYQLETRHSYDLYGERVKKDYFGEESHILIDINDFLNDKGDNEKSTKRPLTKKEILMKSKKFYNHSIITGMQFYDYVKNYLLGDLEQRDIIQDYENYLSETFFDNKTVALIPKVNDDVLTIKIGDEKERPIYNIGEGIQSIILITLPLFLYLDKSKEVNTNILVFIEELEIGLHPELQRILIKTLLNERFKNYQFFFTTHSNHFIDRRFKDEDITIYTFDKHIDEENSSKTNFSIEKVDFNHVSTLKKIGALPSSVLASNCTILVEGSYDINHYTHYLKLYQDKLKNKNPDIETLKEGIHFSFLRGGGEETLKTIENFTPIEKERIFTILDFDSEKESKKKEEMFYKINYKNYEILNVKEVENLISKDILIRILNSIREIRNLGINKDFDEKEYQQDDFYNFIKEKIITGEIPSNFFKKDGLKKRLSEKEHKFVKSYDALSQAAKDITKKIYEFIKKNNV